MLTCFLFGLGVVIVLFLIPLGAKLLPTPSAVVRYKRSLFAVCLGGIVWLTLFNRIGMEVSRVRFQPFYVLRQLFRCWFQSHKVSQTLCRAILKNSQNLLDSAQATPIEDLLLNIILFMPFGFLVPYLWPKLNFWKTVLISFLFSTFIELTQYVAQWGCLDIDDIFNNTLGSCMGFLYFKLYQKMILK